MIIPLLLSLCITVVHTKSIVLPTFCRNEHDVYYNGMCYEIPLLGYMYPEAVNYCRNRDSVIISLHSHEQENFVMGSVRNRTKEYNWAWLGLKLVDGKYQWEDGSPLDYTNWEDGIVTYKNQGVIDAIPQFGDDYFWNDNPMYPNSFPHSDAAIFVCMYIPGTALPEPPTEIPKTPNPPPIGTGKCRTGYQVFNGNCYKTYTNVLLYTEATQHCINDQSDLVSIHSQEEQDFVIKIVKNMFQTNWVWIGMNLMNGTYKWVDGTDMDYSGWSNGYPSYTGDRVSLVIDEEYGSYWEDERNLATGLQFVCKYTLTPSTCSPTDMIVDNRCYSFMTTPDTYQEAEKNCESLGKTLAVFDNVSQVNFVTSKAGQLFNAQYGMYWIGLHRIDTNQFMWPGNVPMIWSYWDAGNPVWNQNGVAGSLKTGKWQSHEENRALQYVCSGVVS